jgi:hypothetical protein
MLVVEDVFSMQQLLKFMRQINAFAEEKSMDKQRALL